MRGGHVLMKQLSIVGNEIKLQKEDFFLETDFHNDIYMFLIKSFFLFQNSFNLRIQIPQAILDFSCDEASYLNI
jgi:hypothetical protein